MSIFKEVKNLSDVRISLPWEEDMRNCIQDLEYHAEGDVWTHTEMVLKELYEMEKIPSEHLIASVVLHDIAKPKTRVEVMDAELNRMRVSHPKHSKLGAIWSNEFLFELGYDFRFRRMVYTIIENHQKIFHLMSNDFPSRDIFLLSHSIRFRDLLKFAEADSKGRISNLYDGVHVDLECLKLMAEEEFCLNGQYEFQNNEHKVNLFRDRSASIFYVPEISKGSVVTVLSGPPGSGKNTYIDMHMSGANVVSFDDIRREMKIKHDDEQGVVIQRAFDMAKGFLRKKEDFVWNSTSMTALSRNRIIDLCLVYGAKVDLVVLDVPYDVLVKQNKNREHMIPEASLKRMLSKWELPNPCEAHEMKIVKVLKNKFVEVPYFDEDSLNYVVSLSDSTF